LLIIKVTLGLSVHFI